MIPGYTFDAYSNIEAKRTTRTRKLNDEGMHLILAVGLG